MAASHAGTSVQNRNSQLGPRIHNIPAAIEVVMRGVHLTPRASASTQNTGAACVERRAFFVRLSARAILAENCQQIL